VLKSIDITPVSGLIIHDLECSGRLALLMVDCVWRSSHVISVITVVGDGTD
jgi:hypothetical protein